MREARSPRIDDDLGSITLSRQTYRLVAGVSIAVAIALPAMVPVVAGIATWKIVLGVVGVALYVAGSRTDSARGPGDGAG